MPTHLPSTPTPMPCMNLALFPGSHPEQVKRVKKNQGESLVSFVTSLDESFYGFFAQLSTLLVLFYLAYTVESLGMKLV